MRSSSLLRLLQISAGMFAPVSSSTPTAQISAGTINGIQCNGSTVNSFLAIPYATPPTGSLRFSPPQAYNGSFPPGGLNATQPAVNCPQFGLSFVENGPQSEDCLTLDVYVPGNSTTSSLLPVKVWLYGGSDEAGGISNPTYTGCFAADESIFVSINYRLGPLGFLGLKDADFTGNYGLQDQLLALQWVQDNIAAFGGNPKQVLLFGQSAGADDTFVLSTLPQIKSYISSAAMESGGGRDLPTINEVQGFYLDFAQLLNCTASDAACFRSASVDQLVQAVNTMESEEGNIPGAASLLEHNKTGDGWGPIVDGKLVTNQPSQTGVQVPSIFGSNADDGTLFVLGAYRAGVLNLTEANYKSFLNYNFGQLANTVEAEFPVSLFNSTPLPVYAAMVTVLTDYEYKCPAYRGLTTAVKNGINVWTYNFNVTPSCPWIGGIPTGQQASELLGSAHTAEIPFVFGEVDNLPLPSGNCSFTSAEKQISKFLKGAWTNMAATGKPTSNDTAWPQWNQADNKGIKIQEAVMATEIDYSVCAFWDNIAAQILQIAQPSTTNGSLVNSTSSSATTTQTGPASPTSSVSLSSGGNPLKVQQAMFCIFLAFPVMVAFGLIVV